MNAKHLSDASVEEVPEVTAWAMRDLNPRPRACEPPEPGDGQRGPAAKPCAEPAVAVRALWGCHTNRHLPPFPDDLAEPVDVSAQFVVIGRQEGREGSQGFQNIIREPANPPGLFFPLKPRLYLRLLGATKVIK
jgi:hypothetical protein